MSEQVIAALIGAAPATVLALVAVVNTFLVRKDVAVVKDVVVKKLKVSDS